MIILSMLGMDWSSIIEICGDFIGTIANATAAICAVMAIRITIIQYNKEKTYERRCNVLEKKDTLFKEAVIDFYQARITDNITSINNKLYEYAEKRKRDEAELKDIFDAIKSESYIWSYEMEIIKFFNKELYSKVKISVENLFDTYSEIINTAIDNKGFLNKYFEVDIKKRLVNIKQMLYEEYLKNIEIEE